MATTTTQPLIWRAMAASTTGLHSSAAGQMPVMPLRSSASPSFCPQQVTNKEFDFPVTQFCRMRLGADTGQKRMALSNSLCRNDDRFATWHIVCAYSWKSALSWLDVTNWTGSTSWIGVQVESVDELNQGTSWIKGRVESRDELNQGTSWIGGQIESGDELNRGTGWIRGPVE